MKLLTLILLFNFSSNAATTLPEIKGSGVKVWDQLISKAKKGDKKSFEKILLYPSGNLLKGVQAYAYRRYIIDLLRENPTNFLNQSYSLLNKRVDCIMTWILFYKREKLMTQDKIEKYISDSKITKGLKRKYLQSSKSFYDDDKFLFNTSGCKNNRFSL